MLPLPVIEHYYGNELEPRGQSSTHSETTVSHKRAPSCGPSGWHSSQEAGLRRSLALGEITQS